MSRWGGPCLAAVLGLGHAVTAGAEVPPGHAGACSLVSATGETLFAGACTILRRAQTQTTEAARCNYLRYEVLYPGIGLAIVAHSDDPDCPPTFQNRPAEFLAQDRHGQLVLATAEGALVRFDPGPPEPPPPMPGLEDFLRGIELCEPTPDYRAFTRSLRQSFATGSGDTGSIAWPVGNPPAGQALHRRQSGAWHQIDVPLRGSYLGLGIAGLRLETEIATGQTRDTVLFADPPEALARQFGATLLGAGKTAAPALPDLPENPPGRLVCTGME